MIDEKDKAKLVQDFIDLVKPMTSEERGEFISELIQINLKITIDECMSPGVLEAVKDNEKKVV